MTCTCKVLVTSVPKVKEGLVQLLKGVQERGMLPDTFILQGAQAAAHREKSPEDPWDSPQVKKGLVPLLEDIRERGTPPDTSVLQGTFDAQTQAALCNCIAKELGFDLSKGRLDVSVHPFTGGRFLVLNAEKRSLLASYAEAARMNGRCVHPSGLL